MAKGKGERGAPNANVLPTNLIMMKSLDVLGCPTVISTVMNPASRAPRLAAVWGWAERGKSSPMRTPGTLVAMAPNSPRAGR